MCGSPVARGRGHSSSIFLAIIAGLYRLQGFAHLLFHRGDVTPQLVLRGFRVLNLDGSDHMGERWRTAL